MPTFGFAPISGCGKPPIGLLSPLVFSPSVGFPALTAISPSEGNQPPVL